MALVDAAHAVDRDVLDEQVVLDELAFVLGAGLKGSAGAVGDGGRGRRRVGLLLASFSLLARVLGGVSLDDNAGVDGEGDTGDVASLVGSEEHDGVWGCYRLRATGWKRSSNVSNDGTISSRVMSP